REPPGWGLVTGSCGSVMSPTSGRHAAPYRSRCTQLAALDHHGVAKSGQARCWVSVVVTGCSRCQPGTLPRPRGRLSRSRLSRSPLSRRGALWLTGLAWWRNRWADSLPADGQVVAATEPFDVPGDDVLNLLQPFLISGLSAQR